MDVDVDTAQPPPPLLLKRSILGFCTCTATLSLEEELLQRFRLPIGVAGIQFEMLGVTYDVAW